MSKVTPHIHNGPFDISKAPVHLSTNGSHDAGAHALDNFNFDGESFEAYLTQDCTETDPGRLVMIETTPVSWATWERHTQGAEVVHILEGEGEFIQEKDGTLERIPVTAGDTVINPPGVWHTADVIHSIKAIYITPCPGTEHKPRET